MHENIFSEYDKEKLKMHLNSPQKIASLVKKLMKNDWWQNSEKLLKWKKNCFKKISTIKKLLKKLVRLDFEGQYFL